MFIDDHFYSILPDSLLIHAMYRLVSRNSILITEQTSFSNNTAETLNCKLCVFIDNISKRIFDLGLQIYDFKHAKE